MDPFLSTFFSSEYVSWYFPNPKNAISGFRWDNLWWFFSRSLRWRCKKQMQQIAHSLPWDCLPFQTINNKLFTTRHIRCARVLAIYLFLVLSLSYIMANLVDMRALTFPWTQEPGQSDPAPSQAKPGPRFTLLLPWAPWCLGRVGLVVQKELWHVLSRVHTWTASWSCSWDAPLPPDLMELQSHSKAMLLI